MQLSDGQWHVVIGLLFSLLFGWGWRLFGDWQRCWKFLFSVGLAAVVAWWAGIHRPPACCSSRLPVFLLRLLQKVNGAQCQQLSLAVLLAWLEPSWSHIWGLSYHQRN
jgi:hypothetical protein